MKLYEIAPEKQLLIDTYVDLLRRFHEVYEQSWKQAQHHFGRSRRQIYTVMQDPAANIDQSTDILRHSFVKLTASTMKEDDVDNVDNWLRSNSGHQIRPLVHWEHPHGIWTWRNSPQYGQVDQLWNNLDRLETQIVAQYYNK